MYQYKILSAKEIDIELLTEIKLLTMIDDYMKKVLSREEKNNIKKNISKNISDNYKKYKIIYLDDKIIGAYLVIDYMDGKIIDEIYLYQEYRNKGIGTSIVRDLLNQFDNMYVWVYKTNEDALRFFKSLGFTDKDDNGRALILKHNKAYIKLIDDLSDIKFGYVDKKGNKNVVFDSDFANEYYLQAPASLMETKVGLSFDQVEYQRHLLTKLKVNFRTYLILYQDSSTGPSHAFLLFKDSNNRYYWYENVWYKYKGIHEYNTKMEALNDIKNKFVETIKDYHENKLRIYQFEKPRSGVNYVKYLSNAMGGKIVRIEK